MLLRKNKLFLSVFLFCFSNLFSNCSDNNKPLCTKSTTHHGDVNIFAGQNCTDACCDGFQENSIHVLEDLENCEEITGNLEIWETSSANLNPLNSLSKIGGDLLLESNENLSNIYGLSNLNSIGKNLTITRNNNLENIIGLINLRHVGKDISIDGDSIDSVVGLSNLKKFEGSVSIFSTAVKTLVGLNHLKRIEGRLNISYNNNLSDISALSSLKYIKGTLDIYDNKLIDIKSLSSLEYVGDNLGIAYNNLSSLDGLENISGIKIKYILENQYLTFPSFLTLISILKGLKYHIIRVKYSEIVIVISNI